MTSELFRTSGNPVNINALYNVLCRHVKYYIRQPPVDILKLGTVIHLSNSILHDPQSAHCLVQNSASPVTCILRGL